MKELLVEELKSLHQFQGISYQLCEPDLEDAIQNLIDELETFLSLKYDMTYDGLEIDEYFEDYD